MPILVGLLLLGCCVVAQSWVDRLAQRIQGAGRMVCYWSGVGALRMGSSALASGILSACTVNIVTEEFNVFGSGNNSS